MHCIGLNAVHLQPKIGRMHSRREFEIAFVGLKPGVHHYQYDIDDQFFEGYDQQDFRNTHATVKLELEKNNSFMRLRFDVGGSVQITCDRCNSELPFQLFEQFNLTVKMVDDPEVMNEQEEDPDVYYISKGDSHLDVKAWLYEFVNLSIPMQKTCEFENMDGPHCNAEARALLKGQASTSGSSANPIWNDLQKFKGLEEN